MGIGLPFGTGIIFSVYFPFGGFELECTMGRCCSSFSFLEIGWIVHAYLFNGR